MKLMMYTVYNVLPIITNIYVSSKVVKESYVDHTQFDKADPHYDP